MTSTITLSKTQAKNFLLYHQFLSPPRSLSGKNSILEILSRLGCIQFDTINVVGRNPDLVLQARIKDYRPSYLEELLYLDRKLIDGWDKVASIYRIEDWPCFSRYRESRDLYYQEHAQEPYAQKSHILGEISKKGPLSPIDFKSGRKIDWGWGPTKIARAGLELLYKTGELGIHHRINTRRYFDLQENLINEKILNQKDPHQEIEQYLEWHFLRRINSLGIASLKNRDVWLGIIDAGKASLRERIVSILLEQGKIQKLQIDHLSHDPLYVDKSSYNQFTKSPQTESSQAAFIAPLDNLIWDRKLLKLLFEFEYIWEVYKPKDTREYGYYVLPVLYGNQFIARVEFGFEKKKKVLSLQNWWWEDKTEKKGLILDSLAGAFLDFKNYLTAKELIINPNANNVPLVFKAFELNNVN